MDLSTAGIKLRYCAEATAGTRPTTGYTDVGGIKKIPELDTEPAKLDTTTLGETEWKTSIPGLKDIGGAKGFLFNMNDTFQTAWETLVSAFETAKSAGKAIWFDIEIPGMAKSFYFTGEPSPLGFGGADVDSVLEGTGYITPTHIEGWATKLAS